MKRFVLQQLIEWKNREDRKPLILNGARQVGKTWLLHEFAKLEYKKEAYVVCRKNNLARQLFSQDFNVDRILRGLRAMTSKSVLLENPRDVSVKNKESQEYFYVYKKGDVLLATDEIADAIVCANNHMGVVVDSKQQYVWMRARKSAQTAFSSLKVNDADKSSSSVVQAVSAMLNYRGNGLSVKELIDNGGTPKSAILPASMRPTASGR